MPSGWLRPRRGDPPPRRPAPVLPAPSRRSRRPFRAGTLPSVVSRAGSRGVCPMSAGTIFRGAVRGAFVGIPVRGDDSCGSQRGRRTQGPPPRARDDAISRSASEESAGPPPRARGRLGEHGLGLAGAGTTPASAGTTCAATPHRPAARTTPASAGTTTGPARSRRSRTDHPRERGDDTTVIGPIESGRGPPPRARGRRRPAVDAVDPLGTTPASAGTTPAGRRPWARRRWDHPRERGDD